MAQQSDDPTGGAGKRGTTPTKLNKIRKANAPVVLEKPSAERAVDPRFAAQKYATKPGQGVYTPNLYADQYGAMRTPEDVRNMTFWDIGEKEQFLADWRRGMYDYGRNYNFVPPQVNPNWDYKNPPVHAITGQLLDKFNNPLPWGAQGFTPIGTPYYGPGPVGWVNQLKSALLQPYEAPKETDSAKVWQAFKNVTKAVVGVGTEILTEPSKMAEQMLYLRDQYPWLSLLYPGDPLAMANTQYNKDPNFFKQVAKTATHAITAIPQLQPFVSLYGFVTDPHIQDLRMGVETPQEFIQGMSDTYWAGRIAYTGIISPLKTNEAYAKIRAGEDPRLVAMELEDPKAELVGSLMIDPLNAVGIGPAKAKKLTRQMRAASDLFLEPVDEIGDALRAMADVSAPERAVDNLDTIVKAQMAHQVKLGNTGVAAWLNKKARQHGLFNMTAGHKRGMVDDVVKEFLHSFANEKDTDTFANALETVYHLGSQNEDEVANGIMMAMHHDNAKVFFSEAGQMASRVIRDVVGDDMEDFMRLAREYRAGGPEKFAKFIDKRVNAAITKMFPTITERIANQRFLAAVESGRQYTQSLVDVAASTVKKIETDFGPNVTVVEVDGDLFYKVGEDLHRMEEETETLYRQSKKILDLKDSDPEALKKVSEEAYNRAVQQRTELGRTTAVDEALDGSYRMARKLYDPLMTAFSNIYMGLSWKYAFRNAWNNYFTNFADEGPGAVFGSARVAAQRLEELLGQVPARSGGITGGPIGETASRGWTLPENWRIVGGKTISPFFGTAMADSFEKASAAKVMYVAAKNAMEKMFRDGRAVPRVQELVDAGLTEHVAKSFIETIRSFNYDVDAAMKYLETLYKEGDVDVLRSLSWMPGSVREVAVKMGIDNEIVNIFTNSVGKTREEILSEVRALRAEFRRARDSANIGSSGIERNSEEARYLAGAEMDMELGEGAMDTVINHQGANMASNNQSYRVAETMREAMARAEETNPALKDNPVWNETKEALRLLSNSGYTRTAVGEVNSAIRNRAVKLKKAGFGKGKTKEEIAALYDELFDEIFVSQNAAGTPFHDNVMKILQEAADVGREVIPESSAALREATWERFWYPRIRRIWAGYRDTLADNVLAMFQKANELLPEEQRIADSVIAPLQDALQQARAFDSDIMDDELNKAFQTAFRNRDNAGMIRARASGYGIATATEKGTSLDKALLNIINGYLSGRVEFSKALKLARKSKLNEIKQWKAYIKETSSDERVETIKKVFRQVDAGEEVDSVDLHHALGSAWSLVRNEKDFNDLPMAMQNRLRDLRKIRMAVERGDLSILPDKYLDLVKKSLSDLADEFGAGEPGKRKEIPNPFGPGTIRADTHSTYPAWYGDFDRDGKALFRNAYYWDEEGNPVTGHAAVDAAFRALMSDQAYTDNWTTQTIRDLWFGTVLEDEDIAGEILFNRHISSGNKFTQEYNKLKKLVLTTTNPNELDPERIADTLGQIVDDLFNKAKKWTPEGFIDELPPGVEAENYNVTEWTRRTAYEEAWAKIVELQEIANGRKAALGHLHPESAAIRYGGQSFNNLDDVPFDIVDEIFREYSYKHPELKGKIVNPVKPYNGGPPNGNRVIYEARNTVEGFFDYIEQMVNENYGKTYPVVYDQNTKRILNKVAAVTRQRAAEAKLVATRVADAARDFALLDYRKRYGFDLALGLIYPYHYWYTRSFKNWMQRLTTSPEVWASWAKYRETMERIHSDMPEWWRYNVNTNDLLGVDMENALFFNLEQMLWPMYGATGTDFDDPKKRVNFMASFMDEMDNFGASPHTWMNWANALVANSQGQKEAAQRMVGRIVPQTKDIRNILTLVGARIPTGQGYNEFDPGINLMSNGIDPYDQKMVARALSFMDQERADAEIAGEKYPWTREELLDAARNQSGDAWDEAVQRMLEYRASGGIKGPAKWIPFLASQLGGSMKPRTLEDMRVDLYDQEKVALLRGKRNLSPDEYQAKWAELNAKYPFGDILSLARGSGDERDEAYTYNVLGRIPTAQKNDRKDGVLDKFGIKYSTVQEFYDTKGDSLKTMNPVDRASFMAAINALGAVSSLPSDATRLRWRTASNSYQSMINAIEEIYGGNVDDMMFLINRFDGNGNIDDVTGFSEVQQERYLRQHPEVIAAKKFRDRWIMEHPEMQQYYASNDKIWGYYRGVAYDRIAKELGVDVFDSWGIRSNREIIAEKNLNEWEQAHPVWNEIDALLGRRKALQEEAKASVQAAFKNYPWLQRASELSDEYSKKINQYTQDTYGVSYDELEAEFNRVFAKFPEDGGKEYNEWTAKHPYWTYNKNTGYAGIEDDNIASLRTERNEKLSAEFGEDIVYGEVWRWFQKFSDNAYQEVSDIDAVMEDNGWWDVMTEHGELVAKRNAAKELTPQQKKYLEIKTKYMAEAARAAQIAIDNLNPIDWTPIRRNAPPDAARKYTEAINASRDQEYERTWTDYSKQMSRELQYVVKDFFFNGDELPYAAQRQLESIAEYYGIDYDLMLEQMRLTIPRIERQSP